MYASRANLSVLLLDRGITGEPQQHTTIEITPASRPFRAGISPGYVRRATQFGATTLQDGNGVDQRHQERDDRHGDTFIAKAVVIATGSVNVSSAYRVNRNTPAAGFYCRL